MLHKLNKEFDIRVNLQGIWSLGPVNPTGFARRKIYKLFQPLWKRVRLCKTEHGLLCSGPREQISEKKKPDILWNEGKSKDLCDG